MSGLCLLPILFIFNNPNNWNHGLSPEIVREIFKEEEITIQTRPPQPEEVDLIEYI